MKSQNREKKHVKGVKGDERRMNMEGKRWAEVLGFHFSCCLRDRRRQKDELYELEKKSKVRTGCTHLWNSSTRPCTRKARAALVPALPLQFWGREPRRARPAPPPPRWCPSWWWCPLCGAGDRHTSVWTVPKSRKTQNLTSTDTKDRKLHSVWSPQHRHSINLQTMSRSEDTATL